MFLSSDQYFYFLFILFLCGCQSVDDDSIRDQEPRLANDTISSENLLRTWKNEALSVDSLVRESTDPFAYFKTGFLLMDSVKHAFTVCSNGDTGLYNLFVHQAINDAWQQIDSLPINQVGISFHLEFLDFNFDGINDLFLQENCSNGYAIRTGKLFEFNPIANKLILHPEVEHLGNFSVDKENKLLIAEEMAECPINKDQPVQVYLELTNNQLIEIKRTHPNCH